VPEETKLRLFLQHDGAPSHFGRKVSVYLNHRYRNRYIDRDCPVPWPLRSPDLTPLDLFLWAVTKEMSTAPHFSREWNSCIEF
jgi:hypothetical protein